MDTKLTKNQRKTSDHRIACSGFHKGSIAPPIGPGSRIIRERSPEGLESEGSDRRRSSRRTQEGRPNRSGRVRPDPEIRTSRRPSPFPSRSKGLISKTYISCRSLPKRQSTSTTFSGPGGRRRWQGYIGRFLPQCCPSWAAASTAPPSSPCLGGGVRNEPLSKLIATEWIRRLDEWHV
jgi:hypothetical protein